MSYDIIAGIIGYVLGSIPFGLLITKAAGLGDIRKIGSKNIGATNVLRTGRKDLALYTLILDAFKGVIAVVIVRILVQIYNEGVVLETQEPMLSGETLGLIAGFCAVLGHNFPIWLKGQGGKGVATTLGIIAVTAWPVFLAAGVTWIVIAFGTRYSSLASILSLSLAPLYAYYFDLPEHMLFYYPLAILTVIRHHKNIGRLIKGEEPKIGQKTK